LIAPRLPPASFPPPLSPLAPAPPSPPESFLTGSPAAPVPAAVRRRVSLSRISHLPPRPRAPPLPAAPALPLVAHRLMLRGLRPNLRPVQRHVSQLHQPRALAQLQYLHEEPRQRAQVLLPKRRDRVVIRMLVG